MICLEEYLAGSELPLATQEVQPSTGAASRLLHWRYSLCYVFIHHWVVWLSYKTGQLSTAVNNQVCREDHQG